MKVLILGAGNAQIDAIDYCKEHGWTVYGCSYTNTDKGIPLLDHFKQVDIKDEEGIAAYAKEEAVDVVYSENAPNDYQMNKKAQKQYGLLMDVLDLCEIYY